MLIVFCEHVKGVRLSLEVISPKTPCVRIVVMKRNRSWRAMVMAMEVLFCSRIDVIRDELKNRKCVARCSICHGLIVCLCSYSFIEYCLLML